MRPLKLLSGLAAPAWRAFRWVVLAPGLWRRSEMPAALMIVRAAVLAFVLGGWIAGMESGMFAAVAAGAAGAIVGAMVAMNMTVFQMLVHDA